MKTLSIYACTGAALAAAALLTSGCRTIHRAPKDGEPSPAVEIAPGDVAPQPVVTDVNQVGTPGTYKEFVIAGEGADQPVAIEYNGLSGQTGRHVSAPPPAPEPEPVVRVPAPTSAGAGVYVVQPGDIFGRIAQKNGVSQKALRDANPSLSDPNKIHPGQKLNLPAKGTGLGAKSAPAAKPAPKKAKQLPAKEGFMVYTVQNGDILGRISKKHGTTMKAIMAANNLVSADKIRAGQQLYIPVAGAAASPQKDTAEGSARAPAPIQPSVEENADFLSGFTN